MKKHSLFVNRLLVILAVAMASAALGFAHADAPSAKDSAKSSTMAAADPVTFNWIDGEPIHNTVYKSAPQKQ